MNQYANQQQSKVQQIFNYQLSNQQEKTFRQLYSQSLQDCSKQLTYFDNASQNCGLCMPYCKICGDSSSCLQCEQQSYYDRSINKCVKKCQNSQYQQDYFEVCISCQVENCDICKFEGQSCQQCKQGWQLSSDKKFCLKSECMAKSYSFYNPETDSCTTNCPESYDLKSRTCIKLKQFSKINTLASKNKIKSEGFIKYVFYFDQISIAVTLDSKYAVIYSYPQLIPINYITCLNTYQGAIKNNQNLFLISEDNVQKIDLLQQNIEIVYQFKSNQFSYSQTKLILYLNPQIVIYSFSTGQEKTYKIKNNFSVDFSPSNLNSFEANNNGDSPNIPDSPQQNEISRLTQIAYDDQGCEFIQKTDQYLITPSLQNLNLIEIDYLSESLVRQQNNIDLFQNANSPQFYESSDSTLLFYLDESNTTSIYYLDKNMLIETSTTADSNIQVLSVYQFDGKTRFIAIKPSIYNGTYQSAVVCANLTLDGTTNQYQFEYDMPHFAQLTSQIIEYIITEDKNYLIIANAQVQKVDNKTLMVSYKNQLQLMYFAEQGSNQIISYSSFTDQDSSYQMNGIFRVFYSEDTNFMAIVYVSGFRIIKVSNQMVLYEKNLKTQIMQAEILFQQLVLLQLYLFNIQNQQATQVFLKSSSENQISIIQSSQAVLYFQNSLVSNYILGSNNFQILYSDNSEYPEAQSQYLQDLFLYGKNAQDQYEVVDFQFNQIYLFSDQSQINYIQELDAFISINQDNQAFVLVLYDSTILAITSNTELVVYDFIINQQIKYLSSSFKCNLYSNFSSDIYCLENNNILKKFDQQLLDFVKIANQPNIQIEVNEFYALSQQILAFISFQGKMVLMNPQTQQVSDVISSLQQIDKINQFTYSNVRDVQHLYSDLFAFTLYNDIVLVKLNSQSSRVVETFRCYDISLSDLAFDHFNEINILLSKHYAVSDQFQYYTSFYGQNIGSNPKYIGITNRPQLESLQIAQKYHIDNIASGNYLDQKLYLNFIDEEDNPFNFIGSDTYYDRSQFYFYLNFQNNSQIIIQEGITAILNQTIGMFELNFQSFYKESQNQTIYIISNQFQQGDYLQIPLNLSYRNCVVGEIIQQNNQFIQCDQCVQGRYSLKIPDMQKDVNQLQCISCPEQAYFCQGSEIKLKNGYWRENNQTDQIYTCILESCAFDNPDSKQGCITGYIGALCNSCDSKQRVWGEQYGFKNMKCYPCSEQLNQISYVCFFILFYVFYTTMSQQKIIASKIKSIKLNIFKQIGLLITSSLSSSGNEASLLYKIFINYIQILSCSSNFGVFNQHILTTPVNLFGDPINMTVSTFDCLFKMSDKYPIWLNRISKENQQITCDLLSPLSNNKKSSATEAPNQLENSNESGFVIENEIYSVQIGQHFIFDNIIASNKFQQTKKDEKSMEAE
ncbi:hypothetical protein ABPG73_008928 [Tetrahymena malaccensis]